ncbi:MAG: NAD(P)H-binding protein [Caldilineaceae bacterium]|nr:NAD(P)H-binding protein [Caldilineaceae bacterium]
MTTLVVGATGATGRLLVEQLLTRGENVRAIVRSPDSLPEAVRNHPNLSVIQASLLELSDAEMVQHVADCDAVASCLGHNLTLKGIFGPPRRLVTDATRRLCQAIQANQPDSPTKFVLMNTTGNRNRDLDEPTSIGQKVVIGLLRHLLPPQADNEEAADYLRTQIGQNDGVIEWAVVRPDGLTNMAQVSEYTVHPSPIRNPIFDAGTTSRINVAHFMAELIINEDTWRTWQGQMPVIYNRE